MTIIKNNSGKLQLVMAVIAFFIAYPWDEVKAQNKGQGGATVCEDKIIAGQVVRRCVYGAGPTYNNPPGETNFNLPPVTINRPAPPAPAGGPGTTPTSPGSGSTDWATYPDGQTTTGTTYTYNPGSINNPPVISCSTSAHQILKSEDQQLWPWTPRGTVTAIEHDVIKYPLRFNPYNAPRFHWGIVETAQNTFGADVEVSVSPCPGDFMAHVKYGKACQKHYLATGGGIDLVIGKLTGINGGTDARLQEGTCQLPGGLRKYYYNIRHVKMNYDGTQFIPLLAGAIAEWSCPNNCQNSVMLSR